MVLTALRFASHVLLWRAFCFASSRVRSFVPLFSHSEKKRWTYIKTNDLQEPSQKTFINCDHAMKAVFGKVSGVCFSNTSEAVRIQSAVTSVRGVPAFPPPTASSRNLDATDSIQRLTKDNPYLQNHGKKKQLEVIGKRHITQPEKKRQIHSRLFPNLHLHICEVGRDGT